MSEEEKDVGETSKEEIERLVHYDALTGLPNRILYMKYLIHALEEAKERESKVAVIFIDLDRFKPINNTFGYEMGDKILNLITDKLKRCVGDKHRLARLGGDEFTILFSGADGLNQVEDFCTRCLRLLEEPFQYGGHLFQIGASIGISVFPDHSDEADTLIQYADIAMYEAKKNGTKGYAVYEPKMSKKISDNFMMASDFDKGLRENEFVLHYQPRFQTVTRKIQCVEALLRWNHPTKGMIPPMQFIPLAEDTGFIIPLGKWVLEQACRKNKEWQDSGLPAVRMAVNCSVRQLQQDDFIPTIREVLATTGLDSEWLEIEITESALMSSEETNVLKLKELHGLGVHISIDDFGTGYSSLNYLTQFDVHALKIDRIFIKQIPNAVIANTIISLCRNLGLDVVAEGVETPEQYEYLRTLGCDEVQGYLFGKPASSDRMERLLLEESHSNKG